MSFSISDIQRSIIIKYGLITGLAGVVILLLGYIMGVAILAKWWFGIIILVVTVVLLVISGREYKNQIGGYISYMDAWITIFGVYVVTAVISTMFSLLLYNVIDTGLEELMREQLIENSITMMEKFGAPEDSIEESIVRLEKQDITPTFKSSGISLIFGIIISAIIALFIKKKKPEALIEG